MVNVSKIPAHMLRDLRARGLKDEEIEQSSVHTLMDEYLKWHGIIGFTTSILGAADALKAAQVK